MSRNQLYIDTEGVKRGYYVYVHKEVKTGKVFYVGKGHGQRAWRRSGRNSHWQKKVEELKGQWKTEIAKDDLSEIEANDLETELVGRLGGPHSESKKLANIFPGGENVARIAYEIDLPSFLKVYNEAYYNNRKYLDLPRDTQEELVKEWGGEVYELVAELRAMVEDTEQKAVKASIDDLESYVSAALEAAMDLLKRKVPWKDFGLNLGQLIEDIDREFVSELSRKVQPTTRKIVKLTKATLEKIDSGNQEEAEDLASKAATRAKTS